MRALLDVNVLLALLDDQHVHHSRARTWLSSERAHGWATCAITQNGFLRIVCQPSYPHTAAGPATAVATLAAAVDTAGHEYWDCSVSLTNPELVDRSRLLGARQVTDVYLLALAVAHGGRFATFDGAVPLAAVHRAAPENLVVL